MEKLFLLYKQGPRQPVCRAGLTVEKVGAFSCSRIALLQQV